MKWFIIRHHLLSSQFQIENMAWIYSHFDTIAFSEWNMADFSRCTALAANWKFHFKTCLVHLRFEFDLFSSRQPHIFCNCKMPAPHDIALVGCTGRKIRAVNVNLKSKEFGMLILGSYCSLLHLAFVSIVAHCTLPSFILEQDILRGLGKINMNHHRRCIYCAMPLFLLS